MKYLQILILAFLCQNTLFAQGYTIIYEGVQQGGVEVVGTTDPAALKRANSIVNIQSYELKHKNGVSNYVWLPNFKNEQKNTSLALKNGDAVEVKHVYSEPSILCKYLANKKYTRRDTDLGKPLLIKDKLPSYDWKISEETKLIGEYVCKKATAMQDQKEITAWFTTSIPIKDGPDKYYGLPGLIIELKHDYMTYRVISLKKTPKVKIIKPSKGKVVTQAEYDKKQEEMFNASEMQTRD